MNREEISYQLEEEADRLFVQMMRTLAEAVDNRCLVHGKLRYIDVPLLNKSIHLIMIYRHIDTINQLAKELELSFATVNRMIREGESKTVNRKSVDKVIDFMYRTADDYEKQNKTKKIRNHY